MAATENKLQDPASFLLRSVSLGLWSRTSFLIAGIPCFTSESLKEIKVEAFPDLPFTFFSQECQEKYLDQV